MMQTYEFDDEVLKPGRFRFHVLRTLSVKNFRSKLFDDQKGICPICKEPLDRNTCVVDHIRSVKSFAYNLEMPLTQAYKECHALENLRAVHRECNSDRNRKDAL